MRAGLLFWSGQPIDRGALVQLAGPDASSNPAKKEMWHEHIQRIVTTLPWRKTARPKAEGHLKRRRQPCPFVK